MTSLTKKRIVGGLTAFGLVSLMALPAIVGATGINDAGAVPRMDQLGLGDASLSYLIQQIITVILGFLGVLAVFIILWGGFIWMTAGGEQDKVDKAKKLIVSGIIGLVIIFAAYAIASFVMTRLTSITGASVNFGQ